jgi:hypothetical protein
MPTDQIQLGEYKMILRKLDVWVSRLTHSTGCVVAAVLLLVTASPAQAGTAVLSVTSGTNGCYDLLAGQTIDAGDVCFEVDETYENLTVTYSTTGNWQLTEAHLWVGDVLDAYPATKKGNPKIGNFPYNAGNITGETTHTFTVPLGPIVDFDLANLDLYCPDGTTGTLYAMAHASVQLVDGSGNVIQTETGWSNGEGVVEKGSWATRSEITLEVSCDDAPPPPTGRGQETAIMFGSLGFDVPLDNCSTTQGNTTISPDNVSDSRWGWQDGPLYELGGENSDGIYINPIYAGAGQSDIAKGTYVGDVVIMVSNAEVRVDIHLFPDYENNDYVVEDTHVYVGTAPVCSANFGNTWTSGSTSTSLVTSEVDGTDLDTSNGVYVGVHLSLEGACNDNGNFCPEAE